MTTGHKGWLVREELNVCAAHRDWHSRVNLRQPCLRLL